MAFLPRGIAPALLFSQVKNTMPYLFEEENFCKDFIPAQVLRNFSKALAAEEKLPETKKIELTHFEYFKLCLCSHYLTVATPVPTDVDNQIRQKLWPANLPIETAIQMADFIIESRKWPFHWVTGRFSKGALGSELQNEFLHGHQGEWFTVACGAYCALKQYTNGGAKAAAEQKREKIFHEMREEIHRHAEIFRSLWKSEDGIGCLKVSAAIAHNMGDLDRVMDMWELEPGDPLRLDYYKLGSNPYDSARNIRLNGRLWMAGELYKSEIQGSSMALENHRHFALRKPKCLRKSPVFYIQTGPFFDDWGRTVADTLKNIYGTANEEVTEVFEALTHGWSRLPRSLGYGRALLGMTKVIPELANHTDFPTIDSLEQSRFEKIWNDQALSHLEDIPSRAQ